MNPRTIAIRSERLLLRPFSASDAEEAYVSITPTLTRFMAFDPPPSRAAFETVWRRWLQEIEDGSDLTFVLRHHENARFVGLAGVHGARSCEPEVGIWVREPDHGHRFGREAVRAIVEWGASALGVSAFRYPVAEDNHPSRRIAETLGGDVIGHEPTPKYRSVIYRIPAARPQGPRSGPGPD